MDVRTKTKGDTEMARYQATFADGTTVTRKSEHEYAYAWKSVHDCPNYTSGLSVTTGFAPTMEAARQRANQAGPMCYGYETVGRYCVKIKRSVLVQKNAELRAQYNHQVEIVEVTRL